jgi:hypothetical protein
MGVGIDKGGHEGFEHDWRSSCDASPKCLDVSSGFTTKDSGKRQEFESGMRRDTEDGKARFDLIFPEGVPYKDQMLTRFAELLQRGATKYGENNWQQANSEEELRRFRSSGLRHMVQWACGETDEDHAAAVFYNLMAFEETKRKIDNDG